MNDARGGLFFRIGPRLALALLLIAFVVTGWIGLDFGEHWDESFALEEISRPLETGVFLPRSYNYASMTFDLGSVALLPESVPALIRAAQAAPPSYAQPYPAAIDRTILAPVVEFAQSHAFLLRLRAVFLLLTSLTGIWIFLAVRAWGRSGWEAALAAGFMLTSWEAAYHARWVAPDAIQMQFAALWLACFSLALRSTVRPLFWLRASAVAAGLACGTKYQGGILLLPVLLQAGSLGNLPKTARETALLLALFAAVFLVTTPGAVLEPWSFVQSLRAMALQYSTGHYGYTVGAPVEHGGFLAAYLGLVLPSRWPAAALAITLLAGWGAYLLVRENRRHAFLLVLAPALYVVFMAGHRVMIARNYLLLLPFLVFAAARGATWLAGASFIPLMARRSVMAGFAALIALQLGFLWHAARTIDSGPLPPGPEIVAHLQRHPAEMFFLSPKAQQALAAEQATPANVARTPADAQQLLLFTDEVTPAIFSCNRPGQYQLVSGPLEMNMDYYASWSGRPRVVALSLARARAMGILGAP